MRQLLASVLLIPLLACSTRMGDLTIATTKNLPQKFEMVGTNWKEYPLPEKAKRLSALAVG